MQTQNIKYLLFDLDHTLWDCDGNSIKSLNVIYDRFNLSVFYPTFDEFNSVYQRVNEELWQKLSSQKKDGDGNLTVEIVWVERFRSTLASKGTIAEETLAQISADYMKLMTTSESLMPNAEDVLQQLGDNYVICIATNGVSASQHSKIESSGLDKYADYIFVSDELGVMKPSKEYFDAVVEALETTPERCVMIGDNPDTDIRGAQDAGIQTIWYNSRNMSSDVETEKIDNLEELLHILL